jgi:hypothetical protein
MLHKEFWGLLFLAFVGWIFVSSSPTQRIEHFCQPVGWVGNVSTSVTALLVPTQQTNVQKWFDKFEYGCQYMTWRLLYQAEYNKAMGLDPRGQPLNKDGTAAPAKAGEAASASASASAQAASAPSTEKAAK